MRLRGPVVVLTTSLAACASQGVHDNHKYVCDIKAYEAKFGEGERTCVARLVAKRCNSVDVCLFECQISGAWETVGGGCDHMCNYEQKVGFHLEQKHALAANEA